MKRLFAFMMALALVLSLSVTAFAENENTGSITITNATVGHTYAPYKIFNASISGGENGGFTYTITTDNQFFDDMFLDKTNPEEPVLKDNAYFTYDPTTGAVAKKEVADSDLLKYLKSLVYDPDTDEVRPGLMPAADPVEATGESVLFDDLDYGYYLITSTLGTTVTINSTDPDVEVIDKNQKPGKNFDKLIYNEDTGKWEKNSSANIGDIVDFKVQFEATNYDGDDQIKHYTISDKKGNALWVEFNSIKVTVDGEELGKGWYFCTNDDPDLNLNTGDWTAAMDSKQWAETATEADWFLIHNGYDDFEIVIPWLDGHTFTGKDSEEDATKNVYELTYPDEPESKYDSPVTVVVEYNASVEPSANISGTSNLYNEVELSWTDDTTSKSPDKPKTDLTVHSFGVTKTDGSDGTLLSGAVFNLFSDEDCTQPVYIIPTNVKGVYILDDLNTVVSGENRETSREKYEDYLEDYLGDNWATAQKNEVVTQANGKLVVLGLEKGTYWLKETEAPAGYNKLATAIEVVIGGETTNFEFKTDADGNIVLEGGTSHIYNEVNNVPVENNKGMELPSTGGKGTMMLITIGSMVAMGFAVLLITHKKMSIYHD